MSKRYLLWMSALVVVAVAARAVANDKPGMDAGKATDKATTTAKDTMGAMGSDMKGDASMAWKGDADFVQHAAMAGMAEVKMGQAASTKAADAQVKSFASRMVTDHTAANDELKSLAAKKGWTLPSELDAMHKQSWEKMAAMSGADFDRHYANHMRQDHHKAVALFEAAAQKATDADLRAWAEKTLPTLREHMTMAEALPVGTGQMSGEAAMDATKTDHGMTDKQKDMMKKTGTGATTGTNPPGGR